jgi:glycogen phosphorylase
LKDLSLLEELEDFLDDKEFRKSWAEIKVANQVRLAKHIKEAIGYQVNSNALFVRHQEVAVYV